MPDGSWISSPSSVIKVCRTLVVSSVVVISPVRRAATALQMKAPMMVGDVYLAREAGLRSPPMLSATSPVPGSAIATMDRQVSAVYSFSVLSLEPADAEPDGSTRVVATAPAAATETAKRRVLFIGGAPVRIDVT